MAYELKDDFTDINENIWSLKRLSKDNRKIVKYLGKNSFQITVRKGDYQMDGGDGHVTERAELTEEKSLWVPTGTLIWYSFYFAFPKDFMLLDNRLVFAQWKQSTKKPESPFLSFRYVNGRLYFQVVYDDKREIFYCKENEWRGDWHKVLVYYKLNRDFQGETKAWADGSLVADHKGRLGSSHPTSDPHFKMGLYRDQIDEPQTIYLANFRRSTSKE